VNLHAYVLRFYCQAATEIATPPYKGSMLRGALFAALRHDFCLDQHGPACMDCHLRSVCPVCCLLATADEDSPRGLEVVRPCTIEPPLDGRTLYRPGDELTFGLTLFGDAADLLPYAVMGVWRMGELGIGNQRRAPGRFAVRRVEAVDPISGRSQELYRQGEERVRRSDIPVTHETVLAVYRALGTPSVVTLALLTPMRLVVDSTLVKRLTFPILMRRLMRRLTDLCQTATHSHPGFDYETLLALAESVRVAEEKFRERMEPSVQEALVEDFVRVVPQMLRQVN
jgi:hypothetical protein